MKSRFFWAAVFLAAAGLLSADPQTLSGKSSGPIVVVVSADEGSVNLLHEGNVVRGWVFSGPYTAAVILAGPLDTLEWDGPEGIVVAGGSDPTATAQKALSSASAPRVLLINTDGAAQVLKAPAGEEDMDYDAASAATEE